MSSAFVSPILPTCSRSSFTTSGTHSKLSLLRNSTSGVQILCARPRTAPCMVGETPSPANPSPLSNDTETTENKMTSSNEPQELSEAASSIEPEPQSTTALDSVDDVLSSIPDVMTSSSSSDNDLIVNESDNGQMGQEFSLDSIKEDDDLANVVVLEECKPPQMFINNQKIAEAREKFRVHESDTGSPEYQIASLTKKIEYLTIHLKEHPKDHSSTRGLLKMVAKRTKLLKYLRRESSDRFHTIIAGLNIRVSQQLRRLGE